MSIRLIPVALAATLVACGGGSPDSQADREAKTRQSLLDFARCMREHGVDMPDPQFDGGRVTMRQSGGDADKLRTAEAACAKFREAVEPPQMSDEERDEFKQAALANARCMREHGVDMPDPQFGEDGGARMRLGVGVDPESPKFREAQEACRGTLPAFGTTDAEEK